MKRGQEAAASEDKERKIGQDNTLARQMARGDSKRTTSTHPQSDFASGSHSRVSVAHGSSSRRGNEKPQ